MSANLNKNFEPKCYTSNFDSANDCESSSSSELYHESTSESLSDNETFNCNKCEGEFELRREDLFDHHVLFHSDTQLNARFYDNRMDFNIDFEKRNDSENLNVCDSENEELQPTMYDCLACEGEMKLGDADLNNHHARHHPNIPLEENIFEQREPEVM